MRAIQIHAWPHPHSSPQVAYSYTSCKHYIIVDCIYIVSYQSVIRSTTGGTLSVPLCSYYTSQNGMTIEMTKVKPFQLFPVHEIPEWTEGWKQKMCWSCLVKRVWLLPWMANAEKVGCSFGGKVHSTDALAVQGCQGPSRWKTLEKGLHFRTCIITADCGVWAGLHKCAQVDTVATRSISSVDWLGLGILAGRLSTGQQQGGNLQGHPGSAHRYRRRPQGWLCLAAHWLHHLLSFVCCLLPFVFGTTQPQDGYVWPSGCTICCPLFTSLGAFKIGISFHIESNFASCGSLAQSGT